MAITIVSSNRGNTSEKVSDTTLALTPSAGLAAGNYGVLLAVTDNVDTDEGVTNDLFVTDTQGHTWTKIREQTEATGAGAAGITAAILIAPLTNGLTTGDSITLTVGASVTAKGLRLMELSVGAGNTLEVAAAEGNNASAATSYSVTISGLASVSRLYIGMTAIERDVANAAGQANPDVDYTVLADVGSTGGGDTSNVAARTGHRTLIGTGDTYDRSGFDAADRTNILVALEEVAAATGRHHLNLPMIGVG